MSHVKFLLILALCFTLFACNGDSEQQEPEELHQNIRFFNNLADLCGESYMGELVYPEDPNHDMAGQDFRMIVESCTESEIRVPFHVGENTSRTWVLTLNGEQLLLKHDHRHSDGTPEDLTMYGGYANDHGNEFRQYFPADQETADMLPEAATNVWMMEIDRESGEFVYYLERHNEPRFRAVFDMGS